MRNEVSSSLEKEKLIYRNALLINISPKNYLIKKIDVYTKNKLLFFFFLQRIVFFKGKINCILHYVTYF